MDDKNSPRKWLSLINIPIQMGVIIYLANRLGVWLDEKYNLEHDMANKICTLLGVGLALYQVIKQVNQLNK
ncbi:MULTISPECIES: AtpZ/AtpI family protein [unclassified Myroides]|uniref:AtpZ/AtpI family protein n=1 Tax=unclassified Myroides TaxID=2642485 RepID=UPI0015F7DD06|nr:MULTISPECIES: AtpZ/AtpI family protein [unclassified Myroides]MBB1149156.1 AtpZ/AtpI family protein [Myroides sp. NP-2]MDM1406083.1 AtpZ/AtpI family protein [Myroides sp. DF42-4-2]